MTPVTPLAQHQAMASGMAIRRRYQGSAGVWQPGGAIMVWLSNFTMV